MKLLVYGLQNSGATLFTYFAAQRPGSLVLPDLWSMYAAPRWSPRADAAVKAVVTTAFPLALHRERFRPDATVLVIRRPLDNFASLAGKPFRNHDGLIEEKFALADRAFRERAGLDAVIRFEDFVARPAAAAATLAALGWAVPDDAAGFPRSARAIEADLWRDAREIYGRIEWGTGNARLGPLARVRLTMLEEPAARRFAETHAPSLTAAYDADPPANARRVTRPEAAQGEADILRAEEHAGRLAALFESALAARDLGEASAVLADLRRIAPQSAAHWRAALRHDEAGARTGLPARVLERALRRRPDATLALVLAQHLATLGEPERAERMIAAFVPSDPMPAAARLVLGWIEVRRGDLDGAARHADAVIDETPRSVPGNLLLAEARRRAGRQEEAEALYRLAASIDPAAPMVRALAPFLGGRGAAGRDVPEV